MAAATPSQSECPVCHEDYTEPKILPCTHLVCRKCLVSWLDKGGKGGGCPLCRAAILPLTDTGEGDLGHLVDTFPTDLVTAAMIKSQNVLSSSNVCVCDESVEALFFCLQCSVKLCSTCTKSHKKLPCSQDHNIQDLQKMSAEELALNLRTPCVSHVDKTAELYCSNHEELICLLCAASTHRKCVEVGGVSEAAKIKREELNKQTNRLKEREAAALNKVTELGEQMKDARAKFTAMRGEVKATFDNLHTSLDTRCEKLMADIQQREDACIMQRMTSKTEVDKYKAKLSAHVNTLNRLTEACDESLLGVLVKLKPRLDGLESQKVDSLDTQKEHTTSVGSLRFDAQLQSQLQNMINAFGLLCDLDKPPGKVSDQTSKCPLCDQLRRCSGLGGPEYATIMTIGDRVRRGRDWDQGKYSNQDGNPPGPGTITEIKPNMNNYNEVSVGVKWDCGYSDTYCMGYQDRYDLQLA